MNETSAVRAVGRVGIALSIQQPWAWLIVNGYKGIENRSWGTRRRGLTLIHAGKKFDAEGYEWIAAGWPHIPMPHRSGFEVGGIVGSANIIDCVTRSDSEWFFGPFGFVLADAKPLPFQPMRGRLGFFPVTPPESAVEATGEAT